MIGADSKTKPKITKMVTSSSSSSSSSASSNVASHVTSSSSTTTSPSTIIEALHSYREKYEVKSIDLSVSPVEISKERGLLIPMVHERRRFTDVMDEEIDDERRRTILDKHTARFVRSRMETCSLDMPRRLKQEVPSRYSIFDEVKSIKNEETFGTAPFLREKPDTCAITENCPLTLTCVVTGVPEPTIQWYKNDVILGETDRITFHTSHDRSDLVIKECYDFDVGLYKVVARNQLGQASHRFRLVQGHLPGPCDSPDVSEVSNTEVLLRWRAAVYDGGSQILCYHLQMKPADETEWQTVADNIDHEFFLVRNLEESSCYHFRVAAKNFMGWGEFSISTHIVKTAAAGTPMVKLSRTMQHLQLQTESGRIVPPFPEKMEVDYSKEGEPVKMKTGENAQLQVRKYQLISEVARGKFSLVAKSVRSDDRRTFVVKLLDRLNREQAVKEEFEAHKSLRHERIVQLFEAYHVGNVSMFVLEPLAGQDILNYLANKHEYSEQHIFLIVTQVLDALSYLHWRGYCHLDLQPDNVILSTTRRCDVKLIDLGSAQKVSRMGSTVPVNGLLEYIAPEVLSDQKAYPNSDIWSLGAIAYALLAGRSAFKGLDEDETRDNIQYVRYRFEYLGTNTSQEAIRFLMLIFKRDPSKRPTVDDVREHRWLAETDFMVKKRERATFLGTRLREYDLAYHREKASALTKSKDLLTFNDANFPLAITYDQELHCVV